MHTRQAPELVDDGVTILRSYLKRPSTDLLRELAPIIVELRARYTLEDGRPDWSGRSPGYRQAIADLYTRARVPEDKLDTVQAAIRYHVGNLLRERASDEELEAVGLTATSPKERLAQTRDALNAMREVAAPRQDIARLAAMAQALLDFIDGDAIPSLPPERAEASRIALEKVQSRSADLLGRIADETPDLSSQPARAQVRRRKRGGGLSSV